MSRPVRDAGEDSDEQRFREAAINMVLRGEAVPSLTETSIHLGPLGARVPVELFVTWKQAWVPAELFVTWKQAGVDRPQEEK